MRQYRDQFWKLLLLINDEYFPRYLYFYVKYEHFLTFY